MEGGQAGADETGGGAEIVYAAAMGDVTAQQRAARALTPAESATLLRLVPAMRAILPESVVAAIDAPQASTPDEAAVVAAPKRPFWKFWAR